jgi:ribose/xylose/arabinose/galactoside ABC-type transport system permease subunit
LLLGPGGPEFERHVVYAGLSSLIATLGLNYMLRGLILIITQGKSIALLSLQESPAYSVFSSQVAGIPVQIFWVLAFVVFSALLITVIVSARA